MRRRIAEVLVRLASRLVPPDRRDAWLEEWRAELWHTSRTEGSEGDASPGSPSGGRAGLIGAAAGAPMDALEIRRLARAPHPHFAARETARPNTMERMTTMGHELKIAVRSLLRSPGFTAVAVLTLALGLGGSAAIYTLLDRVVLDPLPYPEGDRLVRLKNQVPGVGPDEEWHVATAQYVFYNDRAETLDEVGIWRRSGVNVGTPAGPRRARMAMVTVEMMDLLGAGAHAGRLFTPDDARPDAPYLTLLSHGFWLRAFGGDRGVVGRVIDLHGEPYEVVGVLEPGIDLPQDPGAPAGRTPDVWTTIRIDPTARFYNSHVYRGLARLAPDASAEDAQRELEGLQARLPERFPQAYNTDFFERYGFRPLVIPLKEHVVGEMARNLWILLGAVGLVLLVACANVANLFLVRVEERRRELSIRSALGAGRAAIARYLVGESLVLGVAGGLLALVVAWWGLPVLVSVAPETLPRMTRVTMDPGAVVFTAGLSVMVALALAAVPFLRYRDGRTVEALSDGGRGSSAGRDRQRTRGALIVVQVAMALTLVVGAGLLVESLLRLRAIDPGFDPEGVLITDLHVTPADYGEDPELWSLYDRILERVRALPGVTAAGMAPGVPLSGSYGCTVQAFADEMVYQRLEDAGMTTCAGQEHVTPGYFEAMGIPLVRGRVLGKADLDDPSRGSVVVSRSSAERFWPGEDPLGKGIAPNGMGEGPFYRVVGVVGDVPNASLDEEPAIVVYYPVVSKPPSRGAWAGRQTLVVRSDLSNPISLFPAVRSAVAEVDPSIPLANAASMESLVEASMSRVSFVSLLLQVAALAALLLAAVGLYGVVSYVVARRTGEIGVRMAMGAEPGLVQREVVGRSLKLAVLGLGIGVILSLATTRVLEGLLFGVEPTDATAFAGAALLLTVVALLASWLPARRAARVDPAEALRTE